MAPHGMPLGERKKNLPFQEQKAMIRDMRYILSEKPSIRYSEKEQRLFDILAERRKAPELNKELIPVFFGNEQPYDALGQLNTLSRSLHRKIDYNREPFKLTRIRNPGQREVAWKLEKR